MTPKALSPEERAAIDETVTIGRVRGVSVKVWDLLAHIAALEADNAYLLRMLSDYGVYAAHEATCAGRTGPSCDCPGGHPHPGAALLERHEKALIRARNEGLEKGVAWAKAMDSAGYAPAMASVAASLDAMKEPEQ